MPWRARWYEASSGRWGQARERRPKSADAQLWEAAVAAAFNLFSRMADVFRIAPATEMETALRLEG